MIKKVMLFFIMLAMFSRSYTQEFPIEEIESQYENQKSEDEEDLEDDELMQQLQSFKKHPMNLNFADAEELQGLKLLTPAQIDNLVRYRSLLGKLINIYELQAIPDWDVELIRKLLPFITIEEDLILDPKLMIERWRLGNDNLLLRVSTQFKSFVRYRHSFRNLLQFNITTERDAGEKFLDFTSVHFFARDLGLVKRLAIGDFVISIGQGLIMSQGMSLKKSVNVLSIKKQNEILRPYSSSGEYNFHRGVASTLKWSNWQTTLFLSLRSLDANIESGFPGEETIATSIITSGYHRTSNEKSDRHTLKQFSAGASISFRSPVINAGVNFVSYRFSIPIQKEEKPYNAFAFRGDRLTNASVHYERSFRNTHWFGEFATDDQGNLATVNGLLVSLDKKLDCSFLYRKISPKYRSMYSGSFTENSTPVNENGLYAGCSFRLSPRWKVDSYFDV
ncbi:MAG TPA: helix-hairpin-helix domain-containing protein, partial [Chitinophagaceae bacterium]|nr:helix-hairpin-helix domain-containing protein [Chitinophagaceae bacterium]